MIFVRSPFPSSGRRMAWSCRCSRGRGRRFPGSPVFSAHRPGHRRPSHRQRPHHRNRHPADLMSPRHVTPAVGFLHLARAQCTGGSPRNSGDRLRHCDSVALAHVKRELGRLLSVADALPMSVHVRRKQTGAAGAALDDVHWVHIPVAARRGLHRSGHTERGAPPGSAGADEAQLELGRWLRRSRVSRSRAVSLRRDPAIVALPALRRRPVRTLSRPAM
jgi:hypothetical protein